MRIGSTNRWGVLAVVALFGALAGGCAQTEAGTTTSTSETPPTSIAAPTTTTTTPTTTTTGLTTTTSSGTTVDSHLPSSLGRDQVPWAEVGAGWYVVLYDSSKAYPTSEADIREGPSVLFLVNAAGERYEVAAWAPGQYVTLIDATSTTALVERFDFDLDQREYEVVDLTTGSSSTPYTVGTGEALEIWPHASLTRPSGANVVVHRSDGATEWLERRTPDGGVLSVVYEQTYMEGGRSLAWLYGSDGTSLVVTGRDGVFLVSNEGSILGDLWSPPDTRCEPVRWWDADTFLAACFGHNPGSAPLDEFGDPHTYYGRLWLLRNDGTPGSPLTEYPDEPPIVVDFGYHDAWPTDDEIFIQWRGDCGAAAVATLTAGGTGTFLNVEEPEGRFHGVAMVDVHDGELTIYGWEDCAGWVGGLFTVDSDGRYLSTLVPVVSDTRGVAGVRALATVHPSD